MSVYSTLSEIYVYRFVDYNIEADSERTSTVEIAVNVIAPMARLEVDDSWGDTRSAIRVSLTPPMCRHLAAELIAAAERKALEAKVERLEAELAVLSEARASLPPPMMIDPDILGYLGKGKHR